MIHEREQEVSGFPQKPQIIITLRHHAFILHQISAPKKRNRFKGLISGMFLEFCTDAASEGRLWVETGQSAFGRAQLDTGHSVHGRGWPKAVRLLFARLN